MRQLFVDMQKVARLNRRQRSNNALQDVAATVRRFLPNRELLLIAPLLALILNSPAAAEVIKVEGGGTATTEIFYPWKEDFEEETGDTLLTKTSTPVQGLIALENGAVDIATTALPLERVIALAEKEGVKIDPATLNSSVMTKTSIKVFINKPTTVDTLSKEQLKGIFTGKITNWSEVGGSDLPIEVIWGEKTPEQNTLFSNQILDGEPMSAKATLASDYDQIRKFLIKRPGAVGILPHGFTMGALKVVTTPPLRARLS